MAEAPPFWYRKPGLAAWTLWPFGVVYSTVTVRRMNSAPRYISSLPVFCVGNFVVGGAGKTPTVIALVKIARNMGLTPGVLSRGYGGAVRVPTLVDTNIHNARDVGDEPLILAGYATTVVSADRAAGAKMLEEQGVDIILMDDGLQNASLYKDGILAVVDARRGIGNGFPVPAGPMRARLRNQLMQANALLLIGTSDAGTEVVRKAAKMAKPVLAGTMKVVEPDKWTGKRVLAFAGIADSGKFYASLEACGADIVEQRSFHDHHPFSGDECIDILRQARSLGLAIVTTQKDAVRLMRMGLEQQELGEACEIVYVDMEFENTKMVEALLRDTIKRARAHRLVHRA